MVLCTIHLIQMVSEFFCTVYPLSLVCRYFMISMQYFDRIWQFFPQTMVALKALASYSLETIVQVFTLLYARNSSWIVLMFSVFSFQKIHSWLNWPKMKKKSKLLTWY